MGVCHNNTLLDTREYECVTSDGVIEWYSANQIAENLYSQCDTEGHSHLVLSEIVDHKSDCSAMSIEDGYVVDQKGRKSLKVTTCRWQFLCEWKGRTSDWVPLKDLKDSNPIEVAEYVVANQIQEEPAFRWWVRDALHK